MRMLGESHLCPTDLAREHETFLLLVSSIETRQPTEMDGHDEREKRELQRLTEAEVPRTQRRELQSPRVGMAG